MIYLSLQPLLSRIKGRNLSRAGRITKYNDLFRVRLKKIIIDQVIDKMNVGIRRQCHGYFKKIDAVNDAEYLCFTRNRFTDIDWQQLEFIGMLHQVFQV